MLMWLRAIEEHINYKIKGYNVNNLSLLVMAAGMGSRYGGLKQLDSFGPNNETIIDYSVYDAIKSGFEKIVFIIREEFSEDFKTKISDKFKDRIDVEHVYQSLDQVPKSFSVPNSRSKPWGTGHAILSAKNAISGPFMAINGDDFYGRQSFQVASNFYQNEENKFCMVSFKLENTLSEFGGVSRGVCASFERQLISVEETHYIEKKDGEIRSNEKIFHGDELVSMNMWGFGIQVFDYLEERFKLFLNDYGNEEKSEFLIPIVVSDLIKEGVESVDVLNSNEKWFGVTFPEDKKNVSESILKLTSDGAYPEKLF